MESLFSLQPHRLQLFLSPCLMPPLSPNLRHRTLLLSPLRLKLYCTSPSVELQNTSDLITAPRRKRSSPKGSSGTRANKLSDVELKENWLSSLSSPFPCKLDELGVTDVSLGSADGPEWVIGVDPDVSGALALLRTDNSECTAQVFDSPFVQMLVGKKARKRLDAKSIVQLLQRLNAPTGTTAYIEQSNPLPMDGKQGWWGGGFGYGLWIGVLVASGFSVVPVPSISWKNEFELSGSRANKDSSRALASELFPSLSDMLKRKKDHGYSELLSTCWIAASQTISIIGCLFDMKIWLVTGRAEALLIATYGQRCKMKAVESFTRQQIIL